MFTSTTISALPHRLVLASSPYEVTPDLGLFAAITLKSCSLNPIMGPCLFEEVASGSFMNRWGLDNPGIKVVATDTIPRALEVQPNIFLSMFCGDTSEVEPFLDQVPFDLIKAIEINISCPNKELTQSHLDIIQLVQRVVNQRVPLGVKTSLDTVDSIVKHSFDFLTFSNTIPTIHESFGPGGLSGEPLKRKVLAKLSHVRDKFDGTLIACGGVKTSDDYNTYINLGADYVAMASCYLNNKNAAYDILAGI